MTWMICKFLVDISFFHLSGKDTGFHFSDLLRSSSNYLSSWIVFFPAHVESSNVSVDIRLKVLYWIFLLRANKSEPADYSWSAYFIKCIAKVFPKSVHILEMPVLYRIIFTVCDRKGPGVDTGTKRTLSYWRTQLWKRFSSITFLRWTHMFARTS